MENLNSMLPFISQLRSIRLMDPETEIEELIFGPSMSLFQTLSLSSLTPALISTHQMLPTTYITTSNCSLAELHQLLQCAPMLKYLNVKCLGRRYVTSTNNQQYSTDHHALHLKQLIINRCDCSFEDFAMIVKQTPNLKSLTVFTNYNKDMVDACRWQHLITLSLTYLKIFKFKFDLCDTNIKKSIVKKFEEFQSDFWEVQHQWCTEYILSTYTACIYTIPYPSNTYTISRDPIKPFSKTMNTSNSFDNVTDVILSMNIPMVIEDQSYFSNVTSLTIKHTSGFSFLSEHEEDLLEQKFIRFLKKVINLSHLKHLDIRSIESMKTSLILLEILKQAPQVSSLAIYQDALISSFNDNELCKYMNKMIRKLCVYDVLYSSSSSSGLMEQFCRVFSEIEDLECNYDKVDDVLYLLCHLKKLTILKVFFQESAYSEQPSSWIKNEAQKLGLSVLIESDDHESVSLWINRKTN
jgi:hypothetical protein